MTSLMDVPELKKICIAWLKKYEKMQYPQGNVQYLLTDDILLYLHSLFEIEIEKEWEKCKHKYPKIEKEWKERDLVMRLTKLIKFSDFEGITINDGLINYQRRGENYFEDLECDINKEDLSRLLKKNFIVKEKNKQYLLRLRSDFQ